MNLFETLRSGPRDFVRLYLRASAFICGSFAFAFAATAHAEVTAKDAWVRGMVPAQSATGAFVTLTSTVDAKVVGAASPIAKMVEIHETKMAGGTNQMREVESVALPAGKPVTFKPGGYHVMLMGIDKPAKAGETVPITFTIEEKGGKRSQLEVKAEVRALGAR